MQQVLITGANRGIGLALVKQYLDAGWRVFATYRQLTDADELAQLAKQQPKLSLHALDVTDNQQIEALSQQLAAEPLHLLINNAGYYGPAGSQFGHTDEQQWLLTLHINSIAPLKITEAFYPQLKAAQGATVAFLSSKMGSIGDNQSGGSYIYRSSKAALNAVVKSLSLDLASDNILTVALHPGWVQTAMGGPNALINTQSSSQQLKQVLDQLTPAQSGCFINFDGQPLPW